MKGYITNAKLEKDEILENYQHLWQIEKAFRIAESDLKIRPIYHQLQHRIEAHICISFVDYKIYKELEKQLKLTNAGIGPEKAVSIAKSIFQLEVEIEGEEPLKRILFLTKEQKNLASLFAFHENG